ncbi:hypothetical protein Hanom_Chr11g01058311 [Helianthus anomalus]
MPLKYKLQGETKTSVSPLAYKTEDGWWRSELYQFTSDDRVVDLEILFDGFRGSYTMIQAQGIEFRPLEKVRLQIKVYSYASIISILYFAQEHYFNCNIIHTG